MGNNSIIKTTHMHKTTHARHEARDEIFRAPSPFFGGGAWVRGYLSIPFEQKPQIVSNATGTSEPAGCEALHSQLVPL